MNNVKKFLKDYRILLQNVPSMITAIFILSVVSMNLLAGKELYRSEWFCLNSGLALSWISFLCMDCICKRFGPVASTKISVVAMLVNMITVGIFKLLSMTPGRWAAYYSAADAETGELINAGLNSTFGSTWYIVVGSAIAMFLSTLVNSGLNYAIGRKADKGNFRGFATRSFISTIVAQWVDNFVFSLLVSHVFFGWTMTQVLICSTTSMLIEFAFEAIFSPLGYRISKRWEEEKVGQFYLDSIRKAA
ncbi:MAG: VUT family protein [Lachnospiraceae bacterium]|nr:VUT family protein [Lachnospiraceae bacterium]